MDNAGAGKPLNIAAVSVEDIPEALREETPSLVPQQPSFQRNWLIIGLVGLGSLALVTGLWFAATSQSWLQLVKAENNSSSKPNEFSSTSESPISNSSGAPDIVVGNSGHYAYKEAPLSELQPLVFDGRIKLRKSAAQKFQEMVAAARTQGVILVPISGFRSIQEQQYLFFDIKAQRGQDAAERAQVSAPPGYSEHHTGYAVDIGDGRVPATNLSPAFENTAAFRWLKANAPRYSFEMSFPKDNPQGVSYEPWHWRFVGDRDSLETFYKAKQKEG
ncbi:MAG TPA: M15 family metallopeptidase [Leptolyngbyaceae cyanobacterium]